MYHKMTTAGELKAWIEEATAEQLFARLSDIEKEWKINGRTELGRREAYDLVLRKLASEDDFQEAQKIMNLSIYEAGNMNMRLRQLDRCDDIIAGRFNRIFEAIYYARHGMIAFHRLQMCSRQGYSSTLNNDESLFRFRPFSQENLTPLQSLTMYVLHHLSINHHRKCGEYVMKAVYTSQGCYTHAWVEECTVEEYIYRNVTKELDFEQWKNLTHGGGGNAKKCAELVINGFDYEFPCVAKDRHVFAFRNGIYHTNVVENGVWKAVFYEYPATRLSSDVIACKFTDVDFPLVDNPPTPALDSILEYQNYRPEEIFWLYVFIGRLCYNVGEHENWQVMAFFKGQGGSGKSTIVRVCQNLYDPVDVGSISNNSEKQFGLQSLVDRFLVVGPEIKRDFKLEQAEFQSMVSGEEMSIARKFKEPVSVQWKAPVVFAGNESPEWTDNAGSLQRRMVFFQFNRIVVNGDSTLATRLAEEYPNILKRAVSSYVQVATKWGGRDIWPHLPPMFADQKRALAENSNALTAFLGSDRVKIERGVYCKLKDFVAQMRSFAVEMGYRIPKWTTDFYLGPFAMHDVCLKKTKMTWPPAPSPLGKPTHSTFVVGVSLVVEDVASDDGM